MGVTETTEGAVTQVPQSPGFSWKPVETQGFSLNSPSSNQSIIHIIPDLSYLAKRRVFMVALPGPVSTCIFSLCFFQPLPGQPGGLSRGFTHRCMLSESLWHDMSWTFDYQKVYSIFECFLKSYISTIGIYRVYRFWSFLRLLFVHQSLLFFYLPFYTHFMFPRSGIQNHSIGSCVWRWEILFVLLMKLQVWNLWDTPQLNPI